MSVTEHLHSVKVQIDSVLANATLVALALRGICKITNLKPKEVDHLELCLMEALNNVIFHSYNNQAGHSIETLITISQTAISLTVSDWGEVMPDGQLSVPLIEKELTENIEDILPSGRGIPIIKKLMDDLQYRSENGKNSLHMVKHIHA